MKKPAHLITCALLAALLSVPAAAGSLPPQLQLKPGDTGKVFVGVAMLDFRVLEAGEGGWLHVEVTPGLKTGKPERYWLNVNAALLIEPGPLTP
jgi:hypothetical protein